MVLIPFLFPCSPLGVGTIHHVDISAHEDHEDEEHEYERWHNDILCWCIPDTLLAYKEYALARGEDDTHDAGGARLWLSLIPVTSSTTHITIVIRCQRNRSRACSMPSPRSGRKTVEYFCQSEENDHPLSTPPSIRDVLAGDNRAF